jgi:uncharacterized protein (DUF433 family)
MMTILSAGAVEHGLNVRVSPGRGKMQQATAGSRRYNRYAGEVLEGFEENETAMTTSLAYPHIEKRAGHPAHLSRIPRIRVAQIVMDYLAHGWSPDEICRQHPYLKPAEVYSAMAFYFDHQDEIDQEIQAEAELAERARAEEPRSAVWLRIQALRAR